MSKPELLLDTKGIVLSPSTLMRSKGSLRDAVNVTVDAPGVIRSRRGFARMANGFGGPIWKMVSTKQLGANFLINYGTGSAASGLKYGDGSIAPTAITGTCANTPENRMRCAVVHQNHYLTSSNGVQRLETDFSLTFAGMPKGLGIDLTGPANVLTSVVTGWLADGNGAAYRATICKKDQQGFVMEGPPSSRVVVYNKTGTSGYAAATVRNVTCRVILPKANGTTATALTTAYFVRLYRSSDQAQALGDPPDDMRLVYEAQLTSTDITNGYAADFVDNTPEYFRLRGTTLYTNANDFGEDGIAGPGIANSNESPPLCTDVALFANCLWGADVTYRATLEITILSVTAAVGLSVGDTLIIGGITYTAIAPGAPANNQFVVYTASASIQENITRTAQNLVEALNKSTTNTTVYASCVANAQRLPGTIRLEARNISGGFSAVASAHGTAYRPSLVTGASSNTVTYGSGLVFSKPYQPDAMPAVNLIKVGRDDTHILALQVLGNSLFVFTDDGLYQLTGTSFNDWQLTQFDGSFRLLGREMVVQCDLAIYAAGREGIARITESSVEYISVSIEPLLAQIFNSTTLAWSGANGWAVAYRAEHKVIFSFPNGTTDRNASWMLVFDTRVEAWTRWDFPTETSGRKGRSTAFVRDTDGLMFMGIWNPSGTDAWIFQEQHTFTIADYADVDEAGANQAITKTVAWNVLTAKPSDVQIFDEAHLFLEVSDRFSAWTTPTALTVAFQNDIDSKSVALAPAALTRLTRTMVPQSLRNGSRLQMSVTHSVGREYFGLEGGAVVLTDTGSTRTSTK